MKNIEFYWYNSLSHPVKFFNESLEPKNCIGTVQGNTPIKLDVSMAKGSTMVLKQVDENTILVSSIEMDKVVHG